MRWPKQNSTVDAAFAAAVKCQHWPGDLYHAMPQPVHIVDVGSLALDQPEVYEAIADFHDCVVVGFDPQSDAPAISTQHRVVRKTLPVAVGSGGQRPFHATRFAPASSLYPPNHALLKAFLALPTMLEVETVVPMDTVRLEDVAQIDDCDLLKLDVQGGELDVLLGAGALLDGTVAVVTEVEFVPLYEGQPLFADVDTLLRARGFEFVGFNDFGINAYEAGRFGTIPGCMTWADAVYVRGEASLVPLGPDKILKAFMIAHHALRNAGLAAHLLALHDKVAGTALLDHYTPLLIKAWDCAATAGA